MARKVRRAKRRAPAAPYGSEAGLQRAVAQYLDALGLLWCHPPMGGYRTLAVGAELKRQGAKAGVPDVLIFARSPRRPDVRGVALELKTPTGRVSEVQREWHAALAREGWIVRVVRSASDVLDVLREMGWC
jgi:hypothetical protein